MTAFPSSVRRPHLRQSPPCGVFSRLHILWHSEDTLRIAGLSSLVVLQTASLLWLWNDPVHLRATIPPLHLLLIGQCISLIASAVYLWHTIVFHISYYAFPSSDSDVPDPPLAANPSPVALPTCSRRPASDGTSGLSRRKTPLSAGKAGSTGHNVAPVSWDAPAAATAPPSVAAGCQACTGPYTTRSTDLSWPRAVHAALARCVSRVRYPLRLRYLALLRKTCRSGGTPSVEGSHVLITGGSKGIGLALAMECVRRGAALITLVARNAPELEQAQMRCLAEGEACKRSVAIQVLQADVADVGTVQEQLHRAMQLQGKITYSGTASYSSVTLALGLPAPQLRRDAVDPVVAAAGQENAEISASPGTVDSKVLVRKKDNDNTEAEVERPWCPLKIMFCNAALTLPNRLEAMSPASVRRMVDTNLTSVVLQVQAVLPYMRKQQSGCICFSNTLAAQVPIYGLSVYAATKAALAALSSGLEQETAGTNIRFVNAYMPSVATPGYSWEMRVRPPLTSRLEGTVSVLTPEKVASRILNAIGKGKRQVTFGMDGWLVARCTAAFDAADTLAEFFSEVFFVGLLRSRAAAGSSLRRVVPV